MLLAFQNGHFIGVCSYSGASRPGFSTTIVILVVNGNGLLSNLAFRHASPQRYLVTFPMRHFRTSLVLFLTIFSSDWFRSLSTVCRSDFNLFLSVSGSK